MGPAAPRAQNGMGLPLPCAGTSFWLLCPRGARARIHTQPCPAATLLGAPQPPPKPVGTAPEPRAHPRRHPGLAQPGGRLGVGSRDGEVHPRPLPLGGLLRALGTPLPGFWSGPQRLRRRVWVPRAALWPPSANRSPLGLPHVQWLKSEVWDSQVSCVGAWPRPLPLAAVSCSLLRHLQAPGGLSGHSLAGWGLAAAGWCCCPLPQGPWPHPRPLLGALWRCRGPSSSCARPRASSASRMRGFASPAFWDGCPQRLAPRGPPLLIHPARLVQEALAPTL